MVVWLSAVISAQAEVPGAVRAERLVKQLELADKCPDAMYALWQLGSDAVPALSRALRDPRIEVVESACAVLQEMGEVAAPVTTHLQRELGKSEGRRKQALKWALRAVTSQTIAVTSWQGTVVFLDKKGKVVKEYKGFSNLWGVQLLPDGNCLVAQSGGTEIIEVTADGDVVPNPDVELGPGLRAQRMLNGNTLIAGNSSFVRELDAAGKVVWKYDKMGVTATRLLNGHTLVVSSQDKTLVEIGRDGKVVKSWKIPAMVYGVRRLPNGHTLVATRTNHHLLELDADGKTITSTRVIGEPNDVLRYADGMTVIAGKDGVTAYDPAGKELWTHELQWAGCLAR